MTEPLFPPPVDLEVRRIEQTYALAHHTMAAGQSGIFHVRQWNREFEIIVGDYQLCSRPVPRKDKP